MATVCACVCVAAQKIHVMWLQDQKQNNGDNFHISTAQKNRSREFIALLIDANYSVIIVGGAGSCGFNVSFRGRLLLILRKILDAFDWRRTAATTVTMREPESEVTDRRKSRFSRANLHSAPGYSLSYVKRA